MRRAEAITATPGGILLPDAAKEKPREGKVISVGPGRILDNGNREPLSLKRGDVILFHAYAGSEVEIDGEKLLLMDQTDILATVER